MSLCQHGTGDLLYVAALPEGRRMHACAIYALCSTALSRTVINSGDCSPFSLFLPPRTMAITTPSFWVRQAPGICLQGAPSPCERDPTPAWATGICLQSGAPSPCEREPTPAWAILAVSSTPTPPECWASLLEELHACNSAGLAFQFAAPPPLWLNRTQLTFALKVIGYVPSESKEQDRSRLPAAFATIA